MNIKLYPIEHFKEGDYIFTFYSEIEYKVMEVYPQNGKRKGYSILKNKRYDRIEATHGGGAIYCYTSEYETWRKSKGKDNK